MSYELRAMSYELYAMIKSRLKRGSREPAGCRHTPWPGCSLMRSPWSAFTGLSTLGRDGPRWCVCVDVLQGCPPYSLVRNQDGYNARPGEHERDSCFSRVGCPALLFGPKMGCSVWRGMGGVVRTAGHSANHSCTMTVTFPVDYPPVVAY